jgi:hypothetical protein
MTTDRRAFIQQADLGLAAAGLAADAGAKTGGAGFVPCDKLERQGPKEVVYGKRTVASRQNPHRDADDARCARDGRECG